jgi:hypothetical protein
MVPSRTILCRESSGWGPSVLECRPTAHPAPAEEEAARRAMTRAADLAGHRIGCGFADALPDGTTFGFSGDTDERTWMHVIGPGGTDPVLTREVLNMALAVLDRPTLDS